MTQLADRGLSCPVAVPAKPNWMMDYSGVTSGNLAGTSDEQLAQVDPLAANLIVAREISGLEDLDLSRYQRQVNAWAEDFRTRYFPFWETVYARMPEFYDHDHNRFKVGMIAQYLDHEVGISYHERLREAVRIRYLNPADLFLVGLLDTLQGSCGNMAVLHVAMAWRMGWPVSQACSDSHFSVRYDDGSHTVNIEATCTDQPGFVWATDEQLIKTQNISPLAMGCGSDLKALTPRERLGAFLALRGRHYHDMFSETDERKYLHLAEQNYSLAKALFPAYRYLNKHLIFMSALTACERFAPDEAGHPATYAGLLFEVRAFERGTHLCQEPMPPPELPRGSVYVTAHGTRQTPDVQELVS